MGNTWSALITGGVLSLIAAAVGAGMAYRPEMLKRLPVICNIIESKWMVGLLVRREVADV